MRNYYSLLVTHYALLSTVRFYQQLKNIYHWFQAQMWRVYYRWPDRKLTLYGVTGTNGKTTTTIVLGSILRAAYGQEKVGLLSTEIFWLGKKDVPNETHMTSTDAKIVFRYLRQMVESGVTHAVLELTSHALDQHRLAGLRLSGAIILNIAHEHLDYHKTMEEYAAAKMRILEYLIPAGVLVYKADNEWVAKGLQKIQNSKFKIQNSRPFTSEEARSVATPLFGDFNKENVLAACLLAKAQGISQEHIVQGVAAVTHVPGRVEWIALPRGARVVVDFALTPYSYEQLFKYLRSETSGRLIAVFGAAGRRDKAKRPLITRAVAQYADEIVLTQDEPYDDPEEEIYQQLEAGLTDATIPWQRIPDRRAAIKYALEKSQAGDVVAVTGMGNYNTRVVGAKKIPWNDKKVILELAKEHHDSSDY
jgi:UDP-N-acetylmuramoyl-L-alanyl-D-glutamate--2,6-diaminopimelate ligase